MSLQKPCKISIITITLNSERYLEQTITSVTNQSYRNIEYIIIDGGSTDRTLDIIRKYDNKIDRCISEPDDGIADAMNKGVSLSTGDYILFLHSDDYLLNSKVLEHAAPFLRKPYDIAMFSIVLENNGKKSLAAPRGLNWWTNFKTGIFHQSAFCSKELFRKIGPFDTKFHIVMDYDFFLRAYKANITIKIVTFPLSLMRLVGLSSQQNWPSLKERFKEERMVHTKNCENSWMRLLYGIYWSLYFPYRKICSLRRVK